MSPGCASPVATSVATSAKHKAGEHRETDKRASSSGVRMSSACTILVDASGQAALGPLGFGCSKFPVMRFPFLRWRPPPWGLDAGDQQTARRGVIGIRGDPERNKICRTAILSVVMGGRPIDPAQAARRMYASRPFEARMAGCARRVERGKWRESARGRCGAS